MRKIYLEWGVGANLGAFDYKLNEKDRVKVNIK